jgi:hypothetical protein
MSSVENRKNIVTSFVLDGNNRQRRCGTKLITIIHGRQRQASKSKQANKQTNTVFRNSLVVAPSTSHQTSYLNRPSAHIVHTRGVAAGRAEARRRRENARPHRNSVEGVAASMRWEVAGEEGLKECCLASPIRKE